jgi:hypothetical protein
MTHTLRSIEMTTSALRVVCLGMLWLFVVGLLSGCATTRMIDSEVKSFAGATPAPRNATYRFERLPSQEASMDQNVVESMAAKALAKAGPVLTKDNPAYSVQVNLQIVRLPRDPRYDPWMSGYGPVGRVGVQVGVGVGAGPHGGAGRIGYGGMGMYSETPWYRNSVHLVMRELATSTVAFESTATFESPWPDSINIVPVMLEAALQGFPAPPQGPRTVPLELPSEGERH